MSLYRVYPRKKAKSISNAKREKVVSNEAVAMNMRSRIVLTDKFVLHCDQ